MPPAAPLLSDYLAQNVAPVYFWSLLLICIVVAAFVSVLMLRRRLSRGEDAPPVNFTLSDLRRMRDSGELTEEQFQKLRDAVIGAAKRGPQ